MTLRTNDRLSMANERIVVSPWGLVSSASAARHRVVLSRVRRPPGTPTVAQLLPGPAAGNHRAREALSTPPLTSWGCPWATPTMQPGRHKTLDESRLTVKLKNERDNVQRLGRSYVPDPSRDHGGSWCSCAAQGDLYGRRCGARSPSSGVYRALTSVGFNDPGCSTHLQRVVPSRGTRPSHERAGRVGVRDQSAAVLDRVRAGELSPRAFPMGDYSGNQPAGRAERAQPAESSPMGRHAGWRFTSYRPASCAASGLAIADSRAREARGHPELHRSSGAMCPGRLGVRWR